MDRETLLTMLTLFFGGLAVQPFTALSLRSQPVACGRDAEQRAWLRLWLPVIPALAVSAWFCGWAMREPDPIQDHLDLWVQIVASLPFTIVVSRALLRAVWALACKPIDTGVYTVGLLRPQIVFSPFLAKKLDDDMIAAAWQHERAHVSHRDPLRIWLAQLATDLQWPWPWASERFDSWLEALEHARDDEARQRGVSGADLAAAVVTTVRLLQPCGASRPPARGVAMAAHARLSGNAGLLQRRIARLLLPLPATASDWIGPNKRRRPSLETIFLVTLTAACLLGAVYGPPILNRLLAWSF